MAAHRQITPLCHVPGVHISPLRQEDRHKIRLLQPLIKCLEKHNICETTGCLRFRLMEGAKQRHNTSYFRKKNIFFRLCVYVFVCNLGLGEEQWHDRLKIGPILLTFAVERQPPRRVGLYFVAGVDSSQEQAPNVTFWFASGQKQTNLTNGAKRAALPKVPSVWTDNAGWLLSSDQIPATCWKVVS